jgi:Oxidoreductase family, C-terminal alpha/beta domain
MGVDRPLKVSASGGRFELNDAGEMPDILQATFEYPGFVMSYESSNINKHGLGGRTAGMSYYHATGPDDRPHGEAFYGSNGALFCDRIGFEIYPDNDKIARRYENAKDATAAHALKFIDSLRSRKRSNADIEVGHRATAIGHLGNIALKVGTKLEWDAEAERFRNSSEANALLGREVRPAWKLYS